MILLFGFLGKFAWIAGGVLGFGGLAWLAFSNPLVMAFIVKNKGLVVGAIALFVLAFFYSDYRSLKAENALLKADNEKWVDVNKERNKEVDSWKALAEKEAKRRDDAEAANRQNEKDAADRLARLSNNALRFTGDCKTDVAIAAGEFSRMAKPPAKKARSAP
jgi:hypothetical protein